MHACSGRLSSTAESAARAPWTARPVLRCRRPPGRTATLFLAQAFEVDTDGTATTAASETNIQPAARACAKPTDLSVLLNCAFGPLLTRRVVVPCATAGLTSHSVSATAGVGFSVDASDSFPGPLDESTCTTQWTVVEEDNTEFGVPVSGLGWR